MLIFICFSFYLISHLISLSNKNGSLDKFIENQKDLNIEYTEESRLVKWLKQCASAIQYLHSMNRMHRDIKPMFLS